MVFVKTDHKVRSCLKVEVRKPELKSIYEANHQNGDRYLFNWIDLEIPLKVREAELLYEVEDLGRFLLSLSYTEKCWQSEECPIDLILEV